MTHFNLSIHSKKTVWRTSRLMSSQMSVNMSSKSLSFMISWFFSCYWHDRRTRSHTVTDLGNKLGGGSRHLFLAKYSWTLRSWNCPCARLVRFVNSVLGIPVFLRWFWCNSGKKMVLIKFVFAGKYIEDQKFRSSEKYGHYRCFCRNYCLCPWRDFLGWFFLTLRGFVTIRKLRFIPYRDMGKPCGFIIFQNSQKAFRNSLTHSPIGTYCECFIAAD
jgi:hypothetical protein